MLLGLIFSVLSASFNVVSGNAVAQSGSVPDGSHCVYNRTSQTGQKGQLTAGNSSCLSLKGWGGTRIRGMCIRMHSNMSSGGGNLCVRVDGIPCWILENVSFADSLWGGGYSKEWVDVYRELDVEVKDAVEVYVEASENSLYIDSYRIDYEENADRCYGVEFVTGWDSCPRKMYQSVVGEELVLPDWQDTLFWRFVGWSPEELAEDSVPRTLLFPGERWAPRTDSRLWAVYSDGDAVVPSYGVSGAYVLCSRSVVTEAYAGGSVAWCGPVEGGKVSCKPLSMNGAEGKYVLCSGVDDEMVYVIDFVSDSTLRLYHAMSGGWIGYKDGVLYDCEWLWKYRLLGDGSLAMYCEDGGRSYALYAGLRGIDSDIVGYLQAVNLNSWERGGLWLFPVEDRRFTSWPFGKYNGWVELKCDGEVRRVRLGVYELYIKDGRKWMKRW